MITNIEKEIKILNPGKNIEELLLSKGCKMVKYESQLNSIYNDIKLRSIVSHLDNSKRFEWIHKEDIDDGNNPNVKIKKEITKVITMNQFMTSIDLFEFMNNKAILTGVKTRKSYQLGEFLYEYDIWEKEIFPIPYLEVETLNENLDIDEGLKAIWTDEEIENLIISKDSIAELSGLYKKIKDGYNVTFIQELLKSIEK